MNRRSIAALLVALLSPACTVEDAADYVHAEDEENGDGMGVDEAAAGPGVRVPTSLNLDRRGVFYLTFDDGPSPRYTRSILRTLAAHNAPATFFVTGANIANNQTILREVRAAGHVVASHQWSHVVATAAQFSQWVPRQRDALDTLFGERIPRLFRYPYGAGTNAKEAVLRANGYSDGGIGWDVDSLDWCYGPDAYCDRAPMAYRRDMVGYVMAQAMARGGGVVLFHDIQGITATKLDEVLTRMERAGYRFAALPTAGR